MADPLSLQAINKAIKNGSAAFRCRTRLYPVGEATDKVFPPTYAGAVYSVEDRRVDGQVVRCVVLDSVQSQANRMEDLLQDAFLPNWRELPEAECMVHAMVSYHQRAAYHRDCHFIGVRR